jgi:hypothetical protein
VFNATFSNISDISWRPVSVVEEAGVLRREPPTMGKQLVNFITCGCELNAPFFSSPCQRQGELLPSIGVRRLSSVVCRPLTFRILTFSSETSQPNELKLGKKHLWKVLSNKCSFPGFSKCAGDRQFRRLLLFERHLQICQK